MIVNEARAGVRRRASGARERYVAMFAAFVSLGLLAQPTIHAQPSPTADAAAAQQAVETLRDLPTPLPNVGNGIHPLGQPPPIPPSEVTRDASYRELDRLGPAGITALARAYTDPDVRLRRNVALAFLEGSRNSACLGLRGIGPAASDALPALRRALSDRGLTREAHINEQQHSRAYCRRSH
jgi:hypothetical protein